MFLMYRVELKVVLASTVETCLGKFLMYRVELKVVKGSGGSRRISLRFLMYRVELKVEKIYEWWVDNDGS